MTLTELPHESPEAYQASLEERFLAIRHEIGRVTTAICESQVNHSAVASQLGGIAHRLEAWQPRLVRSQLEAHSMALRVVLNDIAAPMGAYHAALREVLEQHIQVRRELDVRWLEHRRVHYAPPEERCWDCHIYDPDKLVDRTGADDLAPPPAELDQASVAEAA